MNHHRVQRVLDLVRHARGQPAERRELARVPDRRLHLTQVLEVPGHEHDAHELARGIVDRVGHDQSLARRRVRRLRIRKRGRYRPARPAADQRLLPQRAQRMIRAEQPRRGKRPSPASGQQRPHGGVRKQQLAARVHDGHRVLEVLDGRLEIGDLPGHLRPIGGQLGADGVEEACPARRTRRR